MRTLDGDQVMLRIFIGERLLWKRKPLHRAIVERLRADGLAGATVTRGIAGFGARRVVHSTSLLALSEDLPVVIEVVDERARIDAVLPVLDEMVESGLITIEDVRVVKWSPGAAPKGTSQGVSDKR